MSEDNLYSDGEVVWVKLGNNWWPGEVTGAHRHPDGLVTHLKRRPYCVVKFFNENTFEYVQSSKKIYPFQCPKKEEFIRKGYALYNGGSKFMEKFPEDVEVAERRTYTAAATATYCNEPSFIINDRPDSIVKAILGQPLVRTCSDDDYYSSPEYKEKRRSGDSITKILNITPSRPVAIIKTQHVSSTTSMGGGHQRSSIPSGQHNNSSAWHNETTNNRIAARISIESDCSPATNNSCSSSTSNTNNQKSNITPSNSNRANLYQCHFCDFTSMRQNVMILHRKMHNNRNVSAKQGAGGGAVVLAATAQKIKPTSSNIENNTKVLTTTKSLSTPTSSTSNSSLRESENSFEDFSDSSSFINPAAASATSLSSSSSSQSRNHTSRSARTLPNLPKPKRREKSQILLNSSTSDQDDSEEALTASDCCSTRRSLRHDKEQETNTVYSGTMEDDFNSTADIDLPDNKPIKKIPKKRGFNPFHMREGQQQQQEEDEEEDYNYAEEDERPTVSSSSSSRFSQSNNEVSSSKHAATAATPEAEIKTDAEEIRKMLLADWSDEDDTPTAHDSEHLPNTTSDASTGSDVILIARDNPAIHNTSTPNSSSINSLGIRNIPKKDRRALVLEDFNNSQILAAEDLNKAKTMEEQDSPNSSEVEIVESNEPQTIITINDDEDDVAAVAAELVIESSVTEVSTGDNMDVMRSSLTTTHEVQQLQNKLPQRSDKSIKDISADILSCFDFQDDEDDEPEADADADDNNRVMSISSSIAHYKKKYLQNSSSNIASNELQQTAKDQAALKMDIQKQKEEQAHKDKQLADEIESLLEQTQSSILKKSNFELENISVRDLPIKERGKRIFKSRNRSKVVLENKLVKCDDGGTTTTITITTASNENVSLDVSSSNVSLESSCSNVENVTAYEETIIIEDDSQQIEKQLKQTESKTVELDRSITKESDEAINASAATESASENLQKPDILNITEELINSEHNNVQITNDNFECAAELISPITLKASKANDEEVDNNLSIHKENSVDHEKNSKKDNIINIETKGEKILHDCSIKTPEEDNPLDEAKQQEDNQVVDKKQEDSITVASIPADETSSTGSTETGGAEFGSPTSMLSEERLPTTFGFNAAKESTLPIILETTNENDSLQEEKLEASDDASVKNNKRIRRLSINYHNKRLKTSHRLSMDLSSPIREFRLATLSDDARLQKRSQKTIVVQQIETTKALEETAENELGTSCDDINGKADNALKNNAETETKSLEQTNENESNESQQCKELPMKDATNIKQKQAEEVKEMVTVEESENMRKINATTDEEVENLRQINTTTTNVEAEKEKEMALVVAEDLEKEDSTEVSSKQTETTRETNVTSSTAEEQEDIKTAGIATGESKVQKKKTDIVSSEQCNEENKKTSIISSEEPEIRKRKTRGIKSNQITQEKKKTVEKELKKTEEEEMEKAEAEKEKIEEKEKEKTEEEKQKEKTEEEEKEKEKTEEEKEKTSTVSSQEVEDEQKNKADITSDEAQLQKKQTRRVEAKSKKESSEKFKKDNNKTVQMKSAVKEKASTTPQETENHDKNALSKATNNKEEYKNQEIETIRDCSEEKDKNYDALYAPFSPGMPPPTPQEREIIIGCDGMVAPSTPLDRQSLIEFGISITSSTPPLAPPAARAIPRQQQQQEQLDANKDTNPSTPLQKDLQIELEDSPTQHNLSLIPCLDDMLPPPTPQTKEIVIECVENFIQTSTADLQEKQEDASDPIMEGTIVKELSSVTAETSSSQPPDNLPSSSSQQQTQINNSNSSNTIELEADKAAEEFLLEFDSIVNHAAHPAADTSTPNTSTNTNLQELSEVLNAEDIINNIIEEVHEDQLRQSIESRTNSPALVIQDQAWLPPQQDSVQHRELEFNRKAKRRQTICYDFAASNINNEFESPTDLNLSEQQQNDAPKSPQPPPLIKIIKRTAQRKLTLPAYETRCEQSASSSSSSVSTAVSNKQKSSTKTSPPSKASTNAASKTRRVSVEDDIRSYIIAKPTNLKSLKGDNEKKTDDRMAGEQQSSTMDSKTLTETATSSSKTTSTTTSGTTNNPVASTSSTRISPPTKSDVNTTTTTKSRNINRRKSMHANLLSSSTSSSSSNSNKQKNTLAAQSRRLSMAADLAQPLSKIPRLEDRRAGKVAIPSLASSQQAHRLKLQQKKLQQKLQQQQQQQQQQLTQLQQQLTQQQPQFILQNQFQLISTQPQAQLIIQPDQTHITNEGFLITATTPNEDDDVIDSNTQLIALPTQPYPGYNETFLLCKVKGNTCKPVDNVPLYLNHHLNELVPIPMEALDPKINVANQLAIKAANNGNNLQILNTATNTFDPNGTQLLTLTSTGAIQDMQSAANTNLILTANSDLGSNAAIMTQQMLDDASSNVASIVGGNSLVFQNNEQSNELLANENVVLNIEGQQVILDAATFAHLLANAEGNTQLISEDGTEYVLTPEVLSALQMQQQEQQRQQQSYEFQTQQTLTPVSGASDILAVALAGSDLYNSEVLTIDTSQAMQLIDSNGSIVFHQPASTHFTQHQHLTPPAVVTNAVLDQSPIMSTLEVPSTMSNRFPNTQQLLTVPPSIQLNSSAGGGNIAGGIVLGTSTNLDDSLAAIGVSASSISSSLGLPITVTNPNIASKVSAGPLNDMLQFVPHRPTTAAAAAVASAALAGETRIFNN